jgi:hypothetical protein
MDFDSIDDKTAFKLGFATRCFELGLEPGQVKEAVEKSAIFSKILPLLAKLKPSWSGVKPWLTHAGAVGTGLAGGIGVKGLVDAGKDISGAMIGLGGGLGLLGGAGIGYGLGKLQEEDVDEDEIKSKELADTYKVYTDRLKSQRAYQQYRKARGAS